MKNGPQGKLTLLSGNQQHVLIGTRDGMGLFYPKSGTQIPNIIQPQQASPVEPNLNTGYS